MSILINSETFDKWCDRPFTETEANLSCYLTILKDFMKTHINIIMSMSTKQFKMEEVFSTQPMYSVPI
jgi:hypothetical protein